MADGLVLGRLSSCAVVLADKKASRRHARLIVQGSVVEVENLGSSNGTLLNDKPVKRRMLRNGDVLQIGATRITYREQAEDDAREPEAEAEAATDDVEVLEFADDDVVRVPKRTPAASPKPAAPKPAPEQASTARPKPSPLDKTDVSVSRGLLLPPKRRGSGTLLGDDLQQMSFPMRLLGYAVALAIAVGLFYLAMKLVS